MPTSAIVAAVSAAFVAVIVPSSAAPSTAQAAWPGATDCSAREPSRSDPGWRCKRASEYDGCIPAEDFAAWRCLELDADATFCEGQAPFRTTVYLTTDGVSLDCNGGAIAPPADRNVSGIRTPYERSVADIGIRDCDIRSPRRYGIDLKRFFRGAELEGPMIGHRDIRVQDVIIRGAGGWGIYVGQNSQRFRFEDVIIDESYGGIYLEAGSSETWITGATIANSFEREGIAVDSSHHNVIQRSLFSGNRGGIHVYKNCGEVYGQVCPIRRPDWASHNVIRFNELHEQWIRVAWRQFKLYGFGWCAGIDVAGYWRDRAPHNLIHGNEFWGYSHGGGATAGLEVSDAPNTVFGNHFHDGARLEMGADAPLGDPDIPMPLTVAENEFDRDGSVRVGPSDAFAEARVFNNRVAGACWPSNACVGPHDLFGGRVLSAGVWTVVL